jgi:Spy/CpxP family protein refolding chaperone
MRRYFLLALGAVGALVLAGGAVVAMNDAPPSPPGRPDLEVMKREAGLTDEQASQLQAIWRTERKQAVRRRADLRVARMELDDLLDAPKVDEKAVQAKVKELADLQGAALRARIDNRLALRRIVSAEQHDKLRALMQRRLRDRAPMGPGGRRGGPGPGRPGGPGPGGRPDRPGGGGDGEAGDDLADLER